MAKEFSLLLHNIRSAHNVGAIFRTAEAAGASRVYLSGYTPTPQDRFGRMRGDIAKSALGAERMLPWEYAATPQRLIGELKAAGWQVIGVEQDERAIDYRIWSPRDKSLLVFGNEVRGISPTMRRCCDILVEIPMRGKKESLNVAVAAGIILFGTKLSD
ncbi:MAG TPA: RNA methyltransferase [Candidatus Paceibacterota bacterium]